MNHFVKCTRLSLMALTLGFAACAVNAQDSGTRVGAVNVEKVFNESNMAKQSQAKLESEFAKRQNELRSAIEKIKAAAEKLDRDGAVMSEAERSRQIGRAHV